MCSISGGTKWDEVSSFIFEKAQDRGRDSKGLKILPSGEWLGSHRATPTTEVLLPIETQPVGENPVIVFNGVISNDVFLGVKKGEADTSVLPRILNFDSLLSFKRSIEKKIIGSYAIASLNKNGKFMLACNYKPIWIAESKGEFYFSSLKNHFPANLSPYKMPPYSVQFLTDKNSNISLKRKQSNQALVICSSGLDSTAVAAYACHIHSSKRVTLLHFNYGCKAERRETKQIKEIANYLGCPYKILEMPSFGKSSLLKKKDVISDSIKGAEYAHEWVPARNLLMLSLATAYAESKGFGHIYLGTNLEEAGAFPDNEEQFILEFNELLYGAVQNGVKIEVHTPLGGLMKHEIIKFGNKYQAPFHLTWSCYRGGDFHCGKCAPCFMRKTAFKRNNLIDPIKYE